MRSQKIKEIAAKDLGGKPDDYDIDGTQGLLEEESRPRA